MFVCNILGFSVSCSVKKKMKRADDGLYGMPYPFKTQIKVKAKGLN